MIRQTRWAQREVNDVGVHETLAIGKWTDANENEGRLQRAALVWGNRLHVGKATGDLSQTSGKRAHGRS